MTNILLTAGPPKVWVIGLTMPQNDGIRAYLNYRDLVWKSARTGGPEDLIEFGGRICYESFHNPAFKSQETYIQDSIVAHEHGSVLEHATVNLAVASLPRSTQLELVRHRAGTAYSFRSTRFTDRWLEFVVPPLLRDDPAEIGLYYEECEYVARRYRERMPRIKAKLKAMYPHDPTLRRKRAKEAARSLLGGNLGSDGEVTFNARALRHVIAMRSDEHADAAIREFAFAVYEAAKPHFPALFADATLREVAFGVPEVTFAHRRV